MNQTRLVTANHFMDFEAWMVREYCTINLASENLLNEAIAEKDLDAAEHYLRIFNESKMMMDFWFERSTFFQTTFESFYTRHNNEIFDIQQIL